MSDIALNLTGVHKKFGSKEILRGISVSVPTGAIMGLIGKNGAGKSTMIKCLQSTFNRVCLRESRS
jgi:ABC-type multidrug transport system ATPase subunit